ncbi:cell division protein FtsY, partial [Escherichia coli ECA-727]
QMAKKKNVAFFPGWALVKKEQTPEKETEVQNEQPVVEEIVQAQEPVKASEQAVEEQPQAHTEAEAVNFCCRRCGSH